MTYEYNRLGRQSKVIQTKPAPDGWTHTVTYGYNSDLQLETETISGSMYERTITRKFETGDNGTIKGRDAGLMVGTSNDPDADYEITYAFETGAQSKGRLKRISNGTSTSIGLSDGGVEYEYVDNGDAVHWINYKNGGGTVLASAEKVYGMSGDHRDLLTSIENRTGTTTVSKYAYANDNAGRRTSVITTGTAFGTGAFNIWAYNDRNELTSSGRYNGTDINNTQSEVTAERRGYGYDPIGNRKTHAIATGGPTVYTTNTVNQYESTAVPRETLQYDQDGNVTRMGVIPADIDEDSFVDTTDFNHFSACLNTTPAPPPCYDTDLNHDSYVIDSDMAIFYSCYAVGQPPACPSPTAPATYTWDAENRLIAVTPISPLASSKKLTFAYDHMSRRIRKQVYTRNTGNTAWNTTPNEDWRFVYDQWNVVLVLNASGTAQKRYAWGLDLSGQNSSPLTKGGTGGWGSGIHGAGGIGGLLAATEVSGTSEASYWYLYDGNGNVGQVIRADNQQTVARYEYDPYGNTIVASGNWAEYNTIRFSTKWFDAETELYDYGYRYYSPRLGRWINRDPIEELGGTALYLFITNNTLSSVDPFGMGVYHVGSDPPDKPKPDKGSGVHGAEGPPTFKDKLAWLKFWTLANVAGRTPNASRHLMHYLLNSGDTLYIAAESMVTDSPNAMTHFFREINDAMTFAEATLVGDKKYVQLTGSWTQGTNEKMYCWDWYYAVAGYSAYGAASVQKLSGCRYLMSFQFNVLDYYNWNQGGVVSILGVDVFDADLGRLHKVGIAKEFEMEGLVTKTILWEKGERYDVFSGKLSGAGDR